MQLFVRILWFSCLILVFGSCTSYRFSRKIQRKDANWIQTQHKNYILFYKPQSLAANDPKLLRKIDSAILVAQRITQLDSFKNAPFHLYIVDNPDFIKPFEKEGRYEGLTYPKSNTILQIHRMAGNSHEYVHLLSIGNWGETEKWIKEGSAVYSEVTYKTLPLHPYANFVLKNNKIADLDMLFQEKKFYKIPSKYSYPISGSLVRYFIETYGFEKFKQLWNEQNLSVIGKTQTEFLNEWKLYVQKFPTHMIIEKN